MQNLNNQNINPSLIIKEISDQYVRKNFHTLNDYFKVQNQLVDFKFFKQTFTAASTNFKIAHGLKYIPQDILTTQLIGNANVTFNYDKFDTSNIDVTVDGPCTIRFFAGTYWNAKDGSNPTSGMILSNTSSTSASVWNFVSKSTTYNAAFGDSILTSGTSAMAINLPTAVGNVGKTIKIKHGGTNFFHVVSLITQKGETIGGVLNYALYTNGETLVIESDGVGFRVQSSFTSTVFAPIPIPVTGTTSPPVISGAALVNQVSGFRQGAYAWLNYAVDSTVAGQPGVGDYVFGLLPGMVMDSSIIPFVGSVGVYFGGITGFVPSSLSISNFHIVLNPSYIISPPLCSAYTRTSFRIASIYQIPQAFVWGPANFSFSTAGHLTATFTILVRIQGWQP